MQKGLFGEALLPTRFGWQHQASFRSSMRCVASHNVMHSGIKTSEMLVITSLCDICHMTSQTHMTLNISQRRPSWLESPGGISHVRNDITPFKEACPLPNYAYAC